MATRRNIVALGLAVLSGILLILTGASGPVGLYQLILQKLQSSITDTAVLSFAQTVASILIIVSSFGGFVVMFGGFLVFMNHVTTGKLAIGLGAGVGILWLLFIAVAIVAGQESPISLIAQHSTLGWVGIILSFLARAFANKPSSSPSSSPVEVTEVAE